MKILLLLFNFLLRVKLRRPFTQDIAQKYGQQSLKKFRKLQRLQLQRDKSQCDLEFLQTCKLNGVFPKFIYFKTSIRNFNCSKLYVSILHKCLDFEIRSKKRKFSKLDRCFVNLLDQFRTEVSWLDYKVTLSKLSKVNANKIKKAKRIHIKKLNALGITNKSNLNANDVIFNFSDRVLTNEEKEILKLGLNFGVPESKVNFVDHFLYFEKFLQQLNKYKSNNENFEELQSKVKSYAQEGFKYNPKKNNHYNINLKVLDDLKRDKN